MAETYASKYVTIVTYNCSNCGLYYKLVTIIDYTSSSLALASEVLLRCSTSYIILASICSIPFTIVNYAYSNVTSIAQWQNL
jgi:hypothetical protein